MAYHEMKSTEDDSGEAIYKAEMIRKIFPGYENFMTVANACLGEFIFGAARQVEEATEGMSDAEALSFIRESPLYGFLKDAGIWRLMMSLPGENMASGLPSRGELLKLFGRLCIAAGDYVRKVEKAGKN